VIDAVTKANLFDQSPCAFARGGVGRPDECRNQHVLENRALWQEAMILKNETYRRVSKGGHVTRRKFERVATVKRHGTVRRLLERAQNV
jgi:hypothetical protein